MNLRRHPTPPRLPVAKAFPPLRAAIDWPSGIRANVPPLYVILDRPPGLYGNRDPRQPPCRPVRAPIGDAPAVGARRHAP